MFPTMKVQNERLQGVVATVKEHINYYEAVVNPVSIKFYFFDSDNPDFDRQFDELRKK